MGPVELLIFDCDGVLVDSEVIGCRIEADLLTEAGFPITSDEIVREFVGTSNGSMYATLEQRYGRPVAADLSGRLRATILAAFESDLAPVPGITQVLTGLSKPMCVASSSEPERIRLCLELTKLLRYFEPHLFSATMVAHGKPAPDLFLYAARQMGVAPPRCVVVEDSVPGIAAARVAGMRVIGLAAAGHCGPGYADRLRDAGATGVASSSAELATMLKDLGL